MFARVILYVGAMIMLICGIVIFFFGSSASAPESIAASCVAVVCVLFAMALKIEER